MLYGLFLIKTEKITLIKNKSIVEMIYVAI